MTTPEATSGGTVIKEESGSFRRFSDKMLYSAVSVVMLLTGTVWALTWFNTDSRVSALHARAAVTESIQQKHVERLIRLEVIQEQMGEIKAKQSVLEGQVNGVQTSLNQVLLELRKGK
jgi:hypothetical protein